MPPDAAAEPPHDCPRCPRLVAFRAANRSREPTWFNGPVPSWGSMGAALLVVGMAPGVRGANRTGRPFTGDHAGRLLYRTLLGYGFASGRDGAHPGDGLRLHDCRVVNAVRCVPPANLPTLAEVKACNPFLRTELAAMPRLRVVLALGVLAHAAVLRALDLRLNSAVFRHGTVHDLPGGTVLADSYHVSRYNTDTGRLTAAMFEDVIGAVRDRIGPPALSLSTA